MERLTSNKKVSDMSMLELAHNSCYCKDDVARYRDFENDIDARDLARELVWSLADIELSRDNECFDEEMIENLQYDITKEPIGLIALFYRNLWAMADLREQLKEYEDLEEQGRLLKLPCKVGDVVYAYCSELGILPYTVDCIVIDEHITYQCSSYSEPIGDCPSECLDKIEPDISEFGKTVFLTQTEAEQKLKKMESD